VEGKAKLLLYPLYFSGSPVFQVKRIEEKNKRVLRKVRHYDRLSHYVADAMITLSAKNLTRGISRFTTTVLSENGMCLALLS